MNQGAWPEELPGIKKQSQNHRNAEGQGRKGTSKVRYKAKVANQRDKNSGTLGETRDTECCDYWMERMGAGYAKVDPPYPKGVVWQPVPSRTEHHREYQTWKLDLMSLNHAGGHQERVVSHESR